MLPELLLPLILLAGYTVFVWFLWRDRPAVSWPRGGPIRRVRQDDARDQERVLFVCTHNSARSQMAEALLRSLAGDRFYIASAGTAPTSVNPVAHHVMAERGLSLRSHRAKALADMGTRWDYVITVCDAAYEQCPDFPAKTCRLHWSVEDPSRVKDASDDQIAAFRRVRDELAQRIRQWLTDQPERP